jgi:hypothetical protein
LETVEEALVLAVGLLVEEETIKDFGGWDGLLFCSLELLLEGAGDPFEA